MKKKDYISLRTKKADELKKSVREKKNELATIAGKVKTGEEKNLKKMHNLRLEIARLLTIIREKEILESEVGESQKGAKPSSEKNI